MTSVLILPDAAGAPRWVTLPSGVLATVEPRDGQFLAQVRYPGGLAATVRATEAEAQRAAEEIVREKRHG